MNLHRRQLSVTLAMTAVFGTARSAVNPVPLVEVWKDPSCDCCIAAATGSSIWRPLDSR